MTSIKHIVATLAVSTGLMLPAMVSTNAAPVNATAQKSLGPVSEATSAQVQEVGADTAAATISATAAVAAIIIVTAADIASVAAITVVMDGIIVIAASTLEPVLLWRIRLLRRLPVLQLLL